ncbi:MAG: 3-ketoacyl-ACP reductase [Planctomycetota bacterium]
MAESRPVALVTGSSRGIGRAIAAELAAHGYDLVVNYASNRDAAAETGALVEANGGRAELAAADVADATARQSLIDATRSAFGRLDVLVNNAGIAPRQRVDLLEATEESYREVMGINLEGPFFLTQLAAQWMVETRKEFPDRALHIVNISSLSEYTSSVLRGDYCLAKAGLGMLTQLFADRLASENILVNAVRPGIIATDMTAAAKGKYDGRIEDGLTPLRRWGKPEDVARVVRALVGGDFSFCTGAVIDVDGGFRLKTL